MILFRRQDGTVLELQPEAWITVGWKTVPALQLKVGESGHYQAIGGMVVHVFRIEAPKGQVGKVEAWP